MQWEPNMISYAASESSILIITDHQACKGRTGMRPTRCWQVFYTVSACLLQLGLCFCFDKSMGLPCSQVQSSNAPSTRASLTHQGIKCTHDWPNLARVLELSQ